MLILFSQPRSLSGSCPQLRCPLILPHSLGFVKNFFQEFFPASCRSSLFVPRRPVQLDYSIRFPAFCQAFFLTFFLASSCAQPSGLPPRRPLPGSSITIPPRPLSCQYLFFASFEFFPPLLTSLARLLDFTKFYLIYKGIISSLSPSTPTPYWINPFLYYICTYNICI